MSTTVPGGEHQPETTPRQVVYRRFASETRTVEVTSTKWTKNSENESLTMPNAKEQLDRVLKWSSEQTPSKSDHTNQDISSTSPKPQVLSLESSQDKMNNCKPDSLREAQFEGRRLSLAQRDKVVGGTAMSFAKPLISKENSPQSERRKSEYDIGRLPSVPFLRSDGTRLTEPKIEEDKMHSKKNVCDNKLKAEPKIEEDKMHSAINVFDNKFKAEPNIEEDKMHSAKHVFDNKLKSEPKIEEDKMHSTKNVFDNKFKAEPNLFLRLGSDKDTVQSKILQQRDKFKSVSQDTSSFSRSEKARFDEPKCDTDKIFLRSEKHVEPKIEENKFQSNVFLQPAVKDKTETKGSSIVRGENTAPTEPKNERDKVSTTSNGSLFQQPIDKATFRSALQGETFSSESKTKSKDSHKIHSSSTTKSLTDKPTNQNYEKVTFQNRPDSITTVKEKSQGADSQGYLLERGSQDKLQSIQTKDSVLTSSAGTSKYLNCLERPSTLENTMPEAVAGKATFKTQTSPALLNTDVRLSSKTPGLLNADDKFSPKTPVLPKTDNKSGPKTPAVPNTGDKFSPKTQAVPNTGDNFNPKTPRFSVTSVEEKPDTESVSTSPKVKGTRASSEKNTGSPTVPTAMQGPSTPIATTGVHTNPTSQPKNAFQDRNHIERKGDVETSRSIGKLEPQACCGETLGARPVTRSKSDVGEGSKGRTATTPTRKSCAERRCCGARQTTQEAATPARARSLSRGPPMGSSASLTPKNKTSWTTQRALEAEVQQLKRELQMHKAEELRLHREIHKLRSVLQQATSFGEETAGTTGDPDDGALLVSLQERHGMAGAAGVLGGASKKQGVSGESCEPESIQVPRHEKDMRSRQLIKAAILDNDFLKNLARCQIRELVDCMYPQRVQMGSYVIREGEAGSHLYVLADGEMEVLKEGTVLGRMGPGKAFGELAILYNCTRTASIRAVSDLQVWVLDRRAFQQIMMRTGMQRLEDNIAFLRSVPLLRGINEQTLARIADALEPEFYPAGEYIVRQGARGNTFFIISAGSVEVTQRGPHGDDVVLRKLERGDYFGEQALLHDDCRTASVRALPPGVDCLTLDRESFSALIGSLSELHHKDYAEDTRSQTSRASFTNDCRQEDEAVGSLRLEDLRPLGTLGVGGFGCVRLVMAPSGRSYALKCLSKRHIAVTGQQEHVTAERDVLLAARSPFIVRLLRTFRDDANVYLLLEACLGGEVWALLREHDRLTDKEARFVAACVLEALEYLHARDIVYRDLKPENLVMDANGYVKLVDFGFCKRLPVGCKTWTFCGTPEYVAPEVILNRGHDRAVDYWALGVLIYELLTGAPPFAAADPMGTYNLILLGMESAIMPKYLSRPATHLIRRLCRAAPSERIGYQRGGFREVKAHRWFQDLDWDALRTQTMIPPTKPQVSGPTDMSNFYPQTLDEDLAPTELSHWDADF